MDKLAVLTAFLHSIVVYNIPLLYGTAGEIMVEKSGSLNLGVEGTRDFFRRVYFERAFDCHSITEAVYYYCMRNGLSYLEALAIISKMPKAIAVPYSPNEHKKCLCLDTALSCRSRRFLRYRNLWHGSNQ